MNWSPEGRVACRIFGTETPSKVTIWIIHKNLRDTRNIEIDLKGLGLLNMMWIGFNDSGPCPAVGICVGFVKPPNANTPLENRCVIVIITTSLILLFKFVFYLNLVIF
jgi:hypothetical protein